ncbi:putative lipoprotein LppI [Mycobacterium ulcerans str. Harvey]|uniref:Lipoprotein LppI n=1 Tax=Mycobacterium ulcerans str. Harvey TaxID=1299332 RepID=A0ABP3AJB1_MYCUL|nr:putative lipoprotein LppI [Mycobacterium ulcerans str. Harvey]
MTREDVTTELGDDIAFSAQGGKVSCLTDTKHTGDAMACLVSLTNPSPPPPTAYGEWKGGWVDFDGTNLRVGPPEATRDRSPTATGPSWPTATRCRSATTVAEPIRPAFLRQLRPSVCHWAQQRRRRAVRLPAVGTAARRCGRRVQLLRRARRLLCLGDIQCNGKAAPFGGPRGGPMTCPTVAGL